MKHIIPTLTLTTLAAASAVAQTAGVKGNGITYDRVGVAYASSDAASSLGVSASADIGSGVILGGFFQDVEIDDSDVEGRGVGASIGYALPVGQGSVYAGVGYQQLWAAGFDGAGAAEATSYTLTYRHAIGSFELGAGVNQLDYSAAATDGVDVVAGSDSDTQWGLSARYNFTKNFDITVGYLFADEDTWSVSAGFNF